MNFIPSKRIFNKNDVIKDIDTFSRKIKLRAHFEADSQPRSELERKFYPTNKSWEPKKTNHIVSNFLEKFKKDTLLELDKCKPHSMSNLDKTNNGHWTTWQLEQTL